VCQCLPGFFSPSSPVSSCLDVDECSSVPGLCGENTACANTVGSYQCACVSGYTRLETANTTGGSILCQDVDECAASQDDCGDHSACLNTEGGYTCTCQEGFSDEESSHCEDIDECAAQPDICGAQAVCANTVGSYECQCVEGYAPGFMGWCEDVDECSSGDTQCGLHAVCVNTDGGYECSCEDGYEGHPPDTPCSLPCDCGDNSDCVRTGGVKVCTCKEGYQGEPPALPCLDIDECLTPACGANADCLNTDPGFTCSCHPGYEGDGITGCYPNMEETVCSSPLDCMTNTTCKQGSCQCKGGFDHAPPLCLDKDECSLTPDICGDNSFCVNIVGGYLCSCKEGYTRYPPSYACTQVNQCKKECGEHSMCEWNEEEQVHRCSCEEGFVELMSGGCVEE